MLRIPQKTIHDYFLLEDLQHDFTYILEALKLVSKDVKDYGITGIEGNDDTDKIQELLNEKGNIYFPKGVYTLTKMIDIYSNTTITAHPEAVFIRKHNGVMLQTATTTETTGYNGEKNIRINGGTYKHNGSLNPSNIFSLFHADDVIFNDVVFLDTVGAHSIDVVASNNVKVLNCKFKGYIATVDNPAKEAIQIDAAGCYSYPIYSDSNAPAYDGTPSCNVLIENCLFCKSDDNPSYPTAVGQHGQLKLNGSRYRNIKILNNIMIGDPTWLYSYGIRIISWEDSLIQGNIIENYSVSIFVDLFSSVVDPHGESIKGETNHVLASDEDIYFITSRNLFIKNNTLKPGISTNARPGIWFNIAGTTLASSLANSPKHRGAIITDNIIYMPSPLVKSYGIDLDTTEDAIISNNTFINNAKSDSIAIGCQDYCKNITIGDNTYKNIAEDNIVFNKNNTENVKKKGRTVLWSGKWYNGKNQLDGSASASGDIITLSDNISNYDALIFEFYYSGFETRIVDFRNSATQTMRTLNLSDAGNSSVAGVNEFVFTKKSETTIELIVNKMQNLANNSITMNSDTIYISKVSGINY